MILTAEKFLEKENLPESISGGTLKHALIEFAKLHVQAALEAASENAYTRFIPFTNDEEIVRESILEAYPLSSIK